MRFLRRSLVRFSRSEASNRTLSLADLITITSESRFSVHTARDAYSKLIVTDPLFKEAPKVGQVMWLAG